MFCNRTGHARELWSSFWTVCCKWNDGRSSGVFCEHSVFCPLCMQRSVGCEWPRWASRWSISRQLLQRPARPVPDTHPPLHSICSAATSSTPTHIFQHMQNIGTRMYRKNWNNHIINDNTLWPYSYIARKNILQSFRPDPEIIKRIGYLPSWQCQA